MNDTQTKVMGPFLVFKLAGGRYHYEATFNEPKRFGREVISVSLAHAVAADDLFTACQQASDIYDALALGPLAAAAKYGPDWEPPTDAQLLELRSTLDNAIAKATESDT